MIITASNMKFAYMQKTGKTKTKKNDRHTIIKTFETYPWQTAKIHTIMILVLKYMPGTQTKSTQAIMNEYDKPAICS